MTKDNNIIKTVTKEEISQMDMVTFPGRIIVIDTNKEAEKAISLMIGHFEELYV